MREWKKKNPARAKQLKAESAKRHPEAKRARDRAWNAAHPDRVRELQAKSGRKNRKRITAYVRAWSRANPLKVAVYTARRRAREAAAPGSHTSAQLEALFASYSGLCVYCDRRATTVDHVVPLAAGGSNDISNLVPACGSCNSSKGDTPLVVWLAHQRAA
jgi:5-methylcytosine-specific restriction endonuclease McrA